ncbi:MAG TPA: hypothetical protein IGR64_09105 [Leptolyngbyaceae cyanobacterium M65_K2018_010]|nr:hypothetical protein [Leptolyngbyaceae cyanobacterium M65_K2018_010]
MEIDLLLLTIYFICVGYVIYQMAQSVVDELEDQVKVIPDQETLNASVRDQLARQGLDPEMVEVVAVAPPPLRPAGALKLTVPRPKTPQHPAGTDNAGQMMVQVLPQGPYPLQPIKQLTVQVLNQTQNLQISVDWDRSSFTRMNNQTRRVIRQIPGLHQDLSLPQVASVVNPNQILNVALTIEETFSRDATTQVLQNTSPLIDINQLMAFPPTMRVYALDLVVQLIPVTGRGFRPIMLLLPFRFRVESLPATPRIPYLAKLVRR